MSSSDRRISTRRALPVGVYLVVDGVRHPGTLRDLSTGGAGFADPVLAVRLDLRAQQRVDLEIPGEAAGEETLRIPGEVAHVAVGLRPRLGIQFTGLPDLLKDKLVTRLGRQAAQSRQAAAGGTATEESEGSLRFVLIEPTRAENRGKALVTTFVLGVFVVLSLLVLLLVASRIG